jgi:hypothetical protein
MANIKRFSVDWPVPGLTVYGIVVRELDTYLLDDANGSFAPAPPDPYLAFTEHPIIAGRYILNESRTIWDNGTYSIAIYSQLGGSPVPSSDTIIGTGQAVLYNDLIRTTIPYPAGVGGITLADIVRRVRDKLDDAVEPYLWSNDTLTDYLNEILNELCRDIPILEDASALTVCRYSIPAGDTTVLLNPRVTITKKGRLESQRDLLPVRSARWMDGVFPGWESAAAGTPSYLVSEGVGTGKVRLYPPSLVDEVLWLTVFRLQLVDMFWGTDQTYQPEIPAIYHDKLFNGILWKAYAKQDVDTLDAKKVDRHERMWIRDKEELRRAVLKTRLRPEVVALSPGWM